MWGENSSRVEHTVAVAERREHQAKYLQSLTKKGRKMNIRKKLWFWVCEYRT